jgi:signal transduction histidine kinase/ActR/RegA family two-component response regulator
MARGSRREIAGGGPKRDCGVVKKAEHGARDGRIGKDDMESTPDDGAGSAPRATRDERAFGARSQTASDFEPGARALAAAELGAFEWDPEADALTASGRLAALLGCEPDAMPRTLAELLARVHEEDRSRFGREMREAAVARSGLRADLRVRADPARARWLRVCAGVLGGRAGERMIGLVEDVTREKQEQVEHATLVRRERALRAAAEQANRSKDEFLSMFSHELRSPLNAILGWNRILAVKRAGDAEVAAMTARIERSAKAQLKMVNDLLDLGRISTGKLKIDSRPTRLASVVAAALDASRPAAAAKGIELASAIEREGSEVYGDPDRLQQVVWNLLSNALKFTETGGRVDVTLRASGGVTTLSVADTGQGIPPELLPHVFDRFRQGDSSTTRHTSGLGLGLALVREIVALHGGIVSASSEGPGRGATFTVRLPALSAHGNASDERLSRRRHSLERSLVGLSILVVDDEADARAMVAETLRLEGARVTVTDSAAAALDELASGAELYDVVVTDIGMPLEDGYSLVRKLRRAPFGERVVAIALTGYASQADRDAAMQAGFDVHVAKPVDFDDFVPLIARMTQATRGARDH